jgi:hypothetical protein
MKNNEKEEIVEDIARKKVKISQKRKILQSILEISPSEENLEEEILLETSNMVLDFGSL